MEDLSKRDERAQEGNALPLPVDRGGWFLVDPEALPDEWRDRAVPIYMIRLDSAEVQDLAAHSAELHEQLDAEEIQVARLLAKGMQPKEIALALHLSRRSVFRRLARLRQLFDAKTNGELATKLAKQDI